MSLRWDVLEWKFPDWAAVTGPAINILKGAILAADRVMTVSQVHPAHLPAPVNCQETGFSGVQVAKGMALNPLVAKGLHL